MSSITQDALNRRLCTPWSLGDVAERMIGQGRPGAAVFRTAIEGRVADRPPVGSHAELVLADAMEAAGLPITRQLPVRLPTGAPVRLDLAVAEVRFAIEVDDPAWHADAVAMQRDHARDLLLATDGWSVHRVTTEDVDERLRSTAANLLVIYSRLISRSLCV
jgi:very-short-patch-repair endonuclease